MGFSVPSYTAGCVNCYGIFTEMFDLTSYDLFIFSELNNCYVLLRYCCVESVHIAEHCCNSFDTWTFLLENFGFGLILGLVRWVANKVPGSATYFSVL